MEPNRLASGTLVSHYRVLSTLGAGGMGEVYAAEDTRLGRKIALKVLPQSVASDASRIGRFEREARAASGLNHPNILTIHDFGQAGESYFIASELVDGMTLRHHLVRGRLKLREAIDIAIQVSSALVAAHDAGIVHRDIKPENIMIRRDGYVKVLDFGLAKLTQPHGDDEPPQTDEATVHRPTDPGTVMGTVHYMSPEQAKGRGVDARTDIFSLGVVLYEMIAGKIPFEGETNSHIIVSILEKQPVPISRIVPDIPLELQRIVQKALAKERDERYQVVKDLLIDLKALRHDVEVAADLESGENLVSMAHRTSTTTPPAGTTQVSSAEYIISGIKKHKRGALVTAGVLAVAVLALVLVPLFTREAESGQRIPVAVADFDNQTGEAELDGLSGMLITSLEQSKRLSVLTRSRMLDTLGLMGKEGVARIDESLGRQVSQREGVHALVTATVQKFGALYIVDLKVLDPNRNEYIFAAKEEGKGKESIPKLIDRLSEQVRLALKESERDVETSSRQIAEATTPNLEAYQHYFKGEEAIGQLHLDEAEEELQKAVAIDPSFGLAWYRLAYAQGWNGSPKAQESIGQAMRLIDRVPEKEQLLIRAEKATADRHIRNAIALLNDVLKRYPDEKEARYLAGDLSYHYGDHATAKLYLRKVLDVDPKHTRAYQHLLWTHRELGEMTEAVAVGRKFLEVSPNDTAYAALLDALSASGRVEEANALARRAIELYPNNSSLRSQVALIRAFYGDAAGARRDIDDYLSSSPPPLHRVHAIRTLAMLDTLEGRFDRALERLNEALQLVPRESLDVLVVLRAEKALLLARSGAPAERVESAIASTIERSGSSSIYTRVALFETYLQIGDFDRAKEASRDFFENPSAPTYVAAMEAVKRGNYGDALVKFEQVRSLGFLSSEIAFERAAAYLGNRDYARALEEVHRIREPQYVGYGWTFERWLHSVPRSSYLEGKIFEEQGDRVRARESYKRFLDTWKSADPTLPEVIDARARLARLG